MTDPYTSQTPPKDSSPEEGDYEFVRLPNGTIRAVPRHEIRDTLSTVPSEDEDSGYARTARPSTVRPTARPKDSTSETYPPKEWVEPSTDDAPARKATAKQRKPEPEPEPDETEWYVHLADGTVERVAESDLPAHSGAQDPHGFWETDGKVLQVIGVYPVETTVPKDGNK